MCPAQFEHAIPGSERPRTYALYRAPLFFMYSSMPLSKFIEVCDYLMLQSHKILDKCKLHIAQTR